MALVRIIAFTFCLGKALLSAEITATAEAVGATAAQRRPNILWITSEDNAAHWLGCYGNTDAQTPHLDALANESVLFTRAYANAPVCAVARSTILHGIYAVSSGTQHMRSRHAIPTSFQPYVSYLRKLGYYCTNNRKTDYNRKGNDREIWDACDRNAHYQQRAAGQSFFAIFNLTVSHESSLFPEKVAANRQRGIIPAVPRLSGDQLLLPPYLPDLPAVRNDFAIYHDTMTALDKQVSGLLQELAELGLAEETLVFYYGDHGGPTPRGKRYLTDTGVRVPMIVHIPKQWQHLSPFQPGERVDELVSFVDLAPTLLSLCDQEMPPQMQGRAFLGPHRVEPAQQPMVFLYADRFDEIEGMRRGLTDGRYKYIRRFTPHLPAAPCSYYSLSMPSWLAWQQAWQADRLAPVHRQIWEAPQPSEQLYDLKADPWETRNLADIPGQASRLKQFRKRLRKEMIDVRDTGIIPESMFRALSSKQTICDYTRSDQFDYEFILDAAMLASAGDPTDLPAVQAMLESDDPVVRYWGALGCIVVGDAAVGLVPQLGELLNDSKASLRLITSHALARVGQQEAAQEALLKELDAPLNPEESIQLINLLTLLNCEPEVPLNWIEKNISNSQVNEYVRRFARRLAEQSTP